MNGPKSFDVDRYLKAIIRRQRILLMMQAACWILAGMVMTLMIVSIVARLGFD